MVCFFLTELASWSNSMAVSSGGDIGANLDAEGKPGWKSRFTMEGKQDLVSGHFYKVTTGWSVYPRTGVLLTFKSGVPVIKWAADQLQYQYQYNRHSTKPYPQVHGPPCANQWQRAPPRKFRPNLRCIHCRMDNTLHCDFRGSGQGWGAGRVSTIPSSSMQTEKLIKKPVHLMRKLGCSAVALRLIPS